MPNDRGAPRVRTSRHLAGKTSFVSTQVRKWSSEYGHDALMVASFTRAAAAEIGGRDLPLERRQVGTLHSFAYRALDGPELVVRHVRDFNDAHPAYRLTVDYAGVDVDDPAYEVSSGTTDGDRLMAQAEVLRAQRVPRDHWPTSTRGFMRAWEDWKRDAGLLDFTDLIELTLESTGDAPGSPAIGCFDEVQDFTPLELALVRRWGARMEIVLLAGDDDQCIYGFKGATPDAFLDPPIPAEHKRVLSTSYRVPRAVHAAASAWITRLTRREPKEYAPRDHDGAVRSMRSANFRAPELVVRDALAVADDGRTAMILATCAFMLDATKTLLRREGIPFHNPYRRKRGDWNPLAPGGSRRRTASDRLLAYLRTQPDVWGKDARWYTGRDLADWIEPMRSDGLLSRGAKRRAEELVSARELDPAELDALLLDVERDLPPIMRAELDWFGAHLLASRAKAFDFPLRVARRRGAATLRERPRIVIGTIHSVKGGEADVVYLYPDLAAPAAARWAAGHTDEIVRQMYVGMTRAREELVVCGQASPLAVDPELITAGAA